MKKILLTTIAASAFAFMGMQGHAHNMSPMKGLKDTTVVASLNGKKITVADVNAYMQGMTKDFRIRLQDLPAQHVSDFVKKYVDTLKYYQKAKEITKTPQYKALMKKIAVDLWMSKEYNKIKVSPEEAKAFYEKNKDLYFKASPKIKARHIIVKDKKLAQKIINELKGLHGKALEQKFAQLAKKYSIGPSKIDGGELGWFEPKQMVAPFAKAVEQLKVGQITTQPVKSRFGYHVILLEDKNSKNYIPFQKVKAQIIAYLKNKKLDDMLTQIDKTTKVKYFIPIKK
ncbi:MAG: cell division protein [Epsilonproteobacteria bacterium]|nr:cell division protein [Campylobacterota bacterium]